MFGDWLNFKSKWSLAPAAGATFVSAFFLWRLRSRRLAQLARPSALDPASLTHRRWAAQMNSFIFDIDGVIHNNGVAIPGAPEAIAALRAAGKSVLFVTNNAGKSPSDIINIFGKYGLEASVDEIMTSAIAAADYLKSRVRGNKVYVVGMAALTDILRTQAGVVPFGGEDDACKTRADALKDFSPALDPPPSEVAAVVAGIDYGINYYKVTRAANYIRQNPHCLWISTNPDAVAKMDSQSQTMGPAAGTIGAAISYASGREPDMVCGKPNEKLAREILRSRGLNPETTCMVGDRTDTDIEFGRNAGMQTLFVESGSMTLQDALEAEPSRRPHFTAPSIAVLSALLTKES